MAWLRIRTDQFNMGVLDAYRDFVLAQKHPTGLTPLERDMIATLVSSLNRCRY
jgi:hypothetical protein